MDTERERVRRAIEGDRGMEEEIDVYDEGYLLWLLKVSSSSALLFSSRTYKDAARKTCNTKPCDTRIRKRSTTYAR